MVLRHLLVAFLVLSFLGSAEVYAAPKTAAKAPQKAPPKKVTKPPAKPAAKPAASKPPVKKAEPKVSDSKKRRKSSASASATRDAMDALKAGRFAEAERIAYGAVESLSWWKSYEKKKDTSSEDLSSQLEKTSKNHLTMMWIAGKAKAERFSEKYDDLSNADRTKLKREITALYNCLLQSSYDSSKTDEFNNTMLAAEETAVKSRYSWSIVALGSLMYWPDKFDYSDAKGEIMGQAICLGAGLLYRNTFNDFSAGGCYGMGNSKIMFDDGAYQDDADTMVIEVHGSAVRKFSDGRIGVGVELSALTRRINIVSPVTQKEDENMETRFVPSVVTRMAFDKFNLDIKGGKVLGIPSAIWVIEFGVPFY